MRGLAILGTVIDAVAADADGDGGGRDGGTLGMGQGDPFFEAGIVNLLARPEIGDKLLDIVDAAIGGQTGRQFGKHFGLAARL